MIEITKKDYKKPCERYQSFHKEEKEKAQQCGCEGYKNFPENEKERLVEYRKRCYKMRKKTPHYNYYCVLHKNRSFLCLENCFFPSNHKKLFLFGKFWLFQTSVGFFSGKYKKIFF